MYVDRQISVHDCYIKLYISRVCFRCTTKCTKCNGKATIWNIYRCNSTVAKTRRRNDSVQYTKFLWFCFDSVNWSRQYSYLLELTIIYFKEQHWKKLGPNFKAIRRTKTKLLIDVHLNNKHFCLSFEFKKLNKRIEQDRRRNTIKTNRRVKFFHESISLIKDVQFFILLYFNLCQWRMQKDLPSGYTLYCWYIDCISITILRHVVTNYVLSTYK